MKKKLLFVLSAFFIAALLLLFGNNREIEKEILIKGDSFIEGLRVIHKKEGNDVWTLYARRADIIESKDLAKLTDVSITVKEKDMTIRAGDGIYDMTSRNLTLNGKVKAETSDYTIITDSAELDNSTGDIKTNGGVRVESKKFNVEGSGMEANSNQKVRILNNVKATFYR